MDCYILLIDDHSILLEAMRMLLESKLANTQVITSSTLNGALLQHAEPGIIILDIKLDGINGIEGIGLLKSKWPKAKIVILSSQDDMATQQLALDRGAASFVSKAEASDRIVNIIAKLQHGKVLPIEDVTTSTQKFLTPRQYEVLDLLCRGLSNKLIARQLDLSENTVRRHNQDIFAFFQVASRTEAVFKAKQMGIIN
jgi:DNA-binding NarL/FixJ family response regulator